MTEQNAGDTATAEKSPAPVTAPQEIVSSIRKYVASEDGKATALLQSAGNAGVRITLVGEKNGVLADRVVLDMATAKAVVDAVEGLEISDEWDRALTSKAAVTPKHWRKMAGWVAHQTRFFPKPRNRKILD